ncbi:MAG: hypothetical protein WC251_03240 [Candidatus Izemoplasmatales bacterium]|jgi:magnesium-transporting ATPase (P-type)|nr:hypothetical protein [Candidatus Izemoplasmatales bacterium]
MLRAALDLMRQKRYIIGSIIVWITFFIIYYLLDYLNGGYRLMVENYGMALVILNIFINVVMTSASAFMMSLSTAYVKLSGKEGKGTFFGSIAVFFGMLTYGCTSCVVAFFATIGITFSVAVLPLAGLPYKLIALVLVLVGMIWLIYEVKRGKCRVPKTKKIEEIKNLNED